MMVLVTGANGFIGRALCSMIMLKGWQIRGTVRDVSSLPEGVDAVKIKSINIDTNWASALKGVDVVVHLAARVHVMEKKDPDPIAAFREVNVIGTERLARTAAVAGVKRFVFLSSIGVNGSMTHRLPLSEKDGPQPHNPYALSKLEAEQVLRRIASESGMELVVIRSPLVYGPGNPGNILRLLSLVDKGWPLPLASVTNSRSLIYLGNLVDAIMTCITHPDAAGKTFLVSDSQDISTSKLLRLLASAMGKKPRLIPFPLALLKVIGTLLGKSDEIQRLTGSLLIDSSRIRNVLGWKPPFSMEEGIRETVKWYKNSTRSVRY
ncbi:MAG: SDR family oxidoreductase [Acetobacterium woodii]|nr:SDR family oxidoreductase [Acetobacterium woodii]MBI5677177.1 SDR family oxidoreductase [Planctomycetota bacterium]